MVSRTGSPEVATDPMAIDQSDVYATLKPPDEWPKGTSKNDLIAAMKRRLQEEAPDATCSFSQPIQMRMQELMEGGSRSDLAIKLHGEDLEILRQKADRIAAVVTKVKGAADVRAERVAGLPYLRVRIRRDAMARHGLDASSVLDTIEAIGGKPVGKIVAGNRRFTHTPGAIFASATQHHRGCQQPARWRQRRPFHPARPTRRYSGEEGPAQISREGGQRRISVEVNVRGRDLAGCVGDAQKAVDAKIKIPDGDCIVDKCILKLMPMSIRMKDIARDLGVSTITVSKVLRNHPDVGEETRLRVLARVKELDYRPNLAARGLVTGHTYLVGLIVPDLLHPFFAEIAASISDSLRREDYYLVVSSSEEDPDLEEQEISQLLARRLDALIIASCRPTVEVFFKIEKQKTPYVLIDRCFPGLSSNFVGGDDLAAGMMATQHLVDIGCKRIAHIRGPETSPGIQRLEGYERALRQNGRGVIDEYVIFEPKGDVGTIQRGAEAMRQLLSRKPAPDGVFCFNDPLAMGAVNEVVNQGFSIPEDIAIIGCGNLHYDDSLRVPLSSVDQHSQLIGAEAARLVLATLKSEVTPKPRIVLLPPELIVRASTQRQPIKTQPVK